MIKRRRKIVNGIEIILLEKTVESAKVDIQPYTSMENTLMLYLDNQFANLKSTIPSLTEEQIQNIVKREIPAPSNLMGSESLLFTGQGSTQVLKSISGEPIDGDIIGYDTLNGGILVWKQNPNIRFDIIDNILNEYTNNFESTNMQTVSLKIPFAVQSHIPPYKNWGGSGKAGIFWNDPWADPINNYSIKMGLNNSTIGETGYTHNWTWLSQDVTFETGSTINYPYVLSSKSFSDSIRTYNLDDLTMKFSNGSEVGRGWVWTRVGSTMGPSFSNIPVMSLTNLGILTTEHCVVSNRYNSLLGRINYPDRKNSVDSLGAFHVVGYTDSGASQTWSGDSIFSLSMTDLTSAHTGYALVYEHDHYEDDVIIPGFATAVTQGIGHIRLRPTAAMTANTMSGLLDTELSSLSDGELITYSASSGDWINVPIDSVGFNRTSEYFIDADPEMGTIIESTDSWKFVPSGYTDWTFVGDDSQTYRSGVKDYTLFWDDNENLYHLIGIRTIASSNSSTTALAYTSSTNFLWAKSTNLSGSSSFSANGIIDTLSGFRVNEHQIDEVWAPHLFKHDSAYYMFYTGVDWNGEPGKNGATSKQRIFVAKTYDVNDWSSPEIKYCLDGSASFTSYDFPIDWTYFCRDPFVIHDDEYNRWLMFLSVEIESASTQNGTQRAGAIGIASAATLMGDWDLYDWIPETETGNNSESPQVIHGTDGNWYLFYSLDSNGIGVPPPTADAIGVLSSSTLSSRDWTTIPSMSATGVACEVVKSKYDENLWHMSYVASGDYTAWSKLSFDRAITFTGSGLVMTYTGHSATTISHTGYSRTQSSVNLRDQVFGHQNEKNIHYHIDELDNRFAHIDELDNRFASISSVTIAAAYGGDSITGASSFLGGNISSTAWANHFSTPHHFAITNRDSWSWNGPVLYFNTYSGSSWEDGTDLISGSTFAIYNDRLTPYRVRFGIPYYHDYGIITIDGSGKTFSFKSTYNVIANGAFSASTYSGITQTKSISIKDPTTNSYETMFYTNRGITFIRTSTICRGTSPSVPWIIRYAADRNTTGTIMNSGTASSITTGDIDTTMTNAAVPANNWVWLEIGTTGGTSNDEFHITVDYKED